MHLASPSSPLCNNTSSNFRLHNKQKASHTKSHNKYEASYSRSHNRNNAFYSISHNMNKTYYPRSHNKDKTLYHIGYKDHLISTLGNFTHSSLFSTITLTIISLKCNTRLKKKCFQSMSST